VLVKRHNDMQRVSQKSCCCVPTHATAVGLFIWLALPDNGYSNSDPTYLSISVLFVNENENGEKRENNEFVNEN